MPEKEAMDYYNTGTTRGIDETREAGARGPGSYLTQLSPGEQKLWNNLFKLYGAIEPFIDYLDRQAALELVPAFINGPWLYISDNVDTRWDNYQAMRDDYQNAGTKLYAEYERLRGEAPNLGLGVEMLIFLVIVVSVGGSLLLNFGGKAWESSNKDPATLRVEALSEQLETANKVAADFAERHQKDPTQPLLPEFLEDLNEYSEKVAEDANIDWAFVAVKAVNVVKWGLVVVGGLILYKVFNK